MEDQINSGKVSNKKIIIIIIGITVIIVFIAWFFIKNKKEAIENQSPVTESERLNTNSQTVNKIEKEQVNNNLKKPGNLTPEMKDAMSRDELLILQ